jgi:hypothetical protein
MARAANTDTWDGWAGGVLVVDKKKKKYQPPSPLDATALIQNCDGDKLR